METSTTSQSSRSNQDTYLNVKIAFIQFIVSQVRVMMAVGWMAFLVSWLMNILFYKVHPSAVDCSMKGVREKLFIHVQGKKRFLWGYKDAKGEK